MPATEPPAGPWGRLPLLVLTAAAGLALVAGAAPADGPAIPIGASPAPSQPCGWEVSPPPGPRTPHPPVRIDGNDPNEQPTVGRPPAYRPGSGIVAGDGSAQNPYLVAGWRLPRVTIRNTDQHFVVADNDLDPRAFPVDVWPDPDLRPVPSVLDGRNVRGTRIVNASNVSLVGNTGAPVVKVGQSPDACVGGNDFAPVGLPGIARNARPIVEVCRSPGTQIVANTGIWFLQVGSRHLRVAGNAFTEGLALKGSACKVGHSDPEPGPSPGFFDHTIPPTNTANGEPIHYVEGVANATVDPPAGQVLVHNATNVTVANVSIVDEPVPFELAGDVVTAFSRNVTVRNVTVDNGDPVRILASPQTTLRGSRVEWTRFGTGVRVARSPNTTLRGNVFEDVLELVVARSPGTRVLGNRMEDFGDLNVRKGSDGTRIVGNNFTEKLHEFITAPIKIQGSARVDVRSNTVRDFGGAVYVFPSGDDSPWESRGLTVTDNRFAFGYLGVLLEGASGTLNVSHNRFVGTAKGVTGVVTTDVPANVTVEANQFRHMDDEAINVQEADSIASIQGNNFGEGVETGVRADEPVDATENWWGCPDGPSDPDCADAKGPITVDPWLTEPNPTAGPRT